MLAQVPLAGLSIRPLVYRIDEGLDVGLLWALRHQQTLPPCLGGECTSGTQTWIGRIPGWDLLKHSDRSA